MLRLSSDTPCFVSVIACVCVCVCVSVNVCVEHCLKALSGSCAVWMMCPLSVACQDIASFVRHPVFCECNCLFIFVCTHMCVCVCS